MTSRRGVSRLWLFFILLLSTLISDPAIRRSLFTVLLSTAISRSIGLTIRRSWSAYGDAIREPSVSICLCCDRAVGRERVLCFNRTGTGLRRLAGDITVTACPDVGAEAGRMHIAFLLNVWGAFTAGYPFNYISQTLHFHFVDSSRGRVRNPSCSLAVGPGLATLPSLPSAREFA
ncbi:hypothetical protein C8R44DRAFT_887603 [Mycena epipterygia]|nr:hypothetical protein C8R44DRAFT_887603 [Mycena epipterygia]